MTRRQRLRGLLDNLTRRRRGAPPADKRGEGSASDEPPGGGDSERSERSEPTSKQRIIISYEPRRDGDADPGEVVWGWVPYEDDPTQGKDRPIVVVGRWGDDLAAVPLTSKDRPGDPDRHLVGTGAWDRERRPSYACLDRVLRLSPGDVRREGSALDQRAFRSLVDALTAKEARG